MQSFSCAKGLKYTQKLQLQRQRAVNESFRRKLLRREAVEYDRQRAKLIKASKVHRREEWLLGSLAPRHDVGVPAETYGTFPAKQLKPPPKLKEERRQWGIAVRDRVCVVGAGERERGKIGVVKQVDESTQTVVVKGLNMVGGVFFFQFPPDIFIPVQCLWLQLCAPLKESLEVALS